MGFTTLLTQGLKLRRYHRLNKEFAEAELETKEFFEIQEKLDILWLQLHPKFRPTHTNKEE